MNLTQAALERIAGRAVDPSVLPALLSAMRAYAIDTPARAAMFLAQVAHESGGFRYVREIWGPTPAQQRYEGRTDLGNTEPGDGQRFMGRGYLQITGRSNYAQVGKALGIDLLAEPEKLELPRLAAVSAAWWWASRKLNVLADHDDDDAFLLVTRRINGGTNGLEDRRRRWAWAREELAALPVPVVPPPEPVVPAPIIDKSTHSAEALRERAALPSVPNQEAPMPAPLAAIAVAAIPELLKRIPEWAAIFSDRSRSSQEQYAEAAIKAAEVAMKATQEATVEGAIARMDADPAALAAAREAAAASANELLGMLLKANEADEKSRDAASARALREKQDLGPWLAEQQFRLNAAFGVATIVAIVVAHVFKIDGSLIAMLYGLFVMQATRASDSWKTIQEYRWGSSMGSAVKDEIINQGRK